MQILNPRKPIVVQLDSDDIAVMHLAFYEFKDLLKRKNLVRKDIQRRYMKGLCKMITLMDFLV